MKYNKLVRDKIPEIIAERGETAKTHIAGIKEYDAKLREKLQEEVAEYLKSGEPIELADILEVVYALATRIGYAPHQLENLRARKAADIGVFEKRIILEEA